MANPFKTRRQILGGIFGSFVSLCGAALPKPLMAATRTPRATEGPFYPSPAMRRDDVDNDLVKIAGRVQEAGGEVITLKGRVFDRQGAPRANHRIEIWQCDMNGKYLHSGDHQKMTFDAAFQGFGHDITDAEGRYVFRTVKPVTYPGRTPHIHVKVFDTTRELLTTQFYIDGHPTNGRDRLFRRMKKAEAAAVSMVFFDTGKGVETTVDVVV